MKPVRWIARMRLSSKDKLHQWLLGRHGLVEYMRRRMWTWELGVMPKNDQDEYLIHWMVNGD